MEATMPLQLNCPKCPQPMEFLYKTTDDSVLVYRCAVHGEWRLGYGGIRPAGDPPPPKDLTETG